MSEDRSFAAVFGEPFFKIFIRNAQRVNAVTEAIPCSLIHHEVEHSALLLLEHSKNIVIRGLFINEAASFVVDENARLEPRTVVALNNRLCYAGSRFNAVGIALAEFHEFKLGADGLGHTMSVAGC